ncbi:hypothetical protein RZS08_41960, partial [Arthrospira platensis SPKY1]|nr:hypothetical protein [Arthrospira platensis SPKY1]
FAFSGSWTERDTLPDGVVEININAAGDSSLLRGEVPFTRQITTEQRAYNRIVFWDVPLMFGFERQWGAWGAALEGGLLFNLALSASGRVLPTAEQAPPMPLAETLRPKA